jgi:hypothetical protein
MGPVWGLGSGGQGRIKGKGIRGWIWWEYSVLMYANGIIRLVETVPGVGGSRDKGKWWGGEVNYDKL